MKTILAKILILILMMTASLSFVQAQKTEVPDKRQLSLVTKHDGTEFVGFILKSDEREVLIETKELGNIIIPKHEIESIKVLEEDDLVMGKYYGENRFASRYFLTTNGLPVKKGESYGMISIYGPEIHFAVVENFSVGIMTSWGFIPIVGSFKYSTKISEKVSLGIGALVGISPYTDVSGGGALGFGSLTFGDRRSNLSISAGFAGVTPFNNEFRSGGSAPLLSVAGMSKVGKKLSFLVDSFIYLQKDSKFALIMPGLRFSGSPKSAFQIGAGMLVVDNELFPLPIPVLTWFRAIN